ncbi:DUF418 domain-containing protein [Streptomyces sp. PCS3-D2]|uniref:DUF418 domain-containing protein n=1 Tax=Streptomyces sp. PCS3-D2 TaxID=1460244 RepID=UPI0004518AA7|nr:DUF418 domain-containing protein [Streptomyces sp. PCS3-D2]WKV70069.1 DUF418 domain-containing protein [Streptomyces sp. PCS3-D2]
MRNSHSSARVQSLDVLRGTAIIGTLLTNIWIFTQITDSHESVRGAPAGLFGNSLNTGIADVSDMLSNGKFLSLLSILFGVGMAIQFESAMRHGHRWPWRYEWRSLLLLADGFLHFALVVEFDILMGYALVAMVVAPLLLLRTRWLVLAGVVAGAFHLFMQFGEASTSLNAGSVAEAPERLPAGDSIARGGDGGAASLGYFDQVAHRLGNFWELRAEAFQIAPPLTAFLLIMGVLMWRAGLFTADERAKRLSTWLAVGGLGVGVPAMLWPRLSLPGAEVLDSLARYTVAPIVAFGYLGLILILLRRGGGKSPLSRHMAAVGRTALSCYMLQNVLAMIAFSTWGLHLGPLDSVGTIIAWAVISAILMLAASLWLRRFRQGPFELAWKAAVEAPFRRRDRMRAEKAAAHQRAQGERHHNDNNAPTGAT